MAKPIHCQAGLLRVVRGLFSVVMAERSKCRELVTRPVSGAGAKTKIHYCLGFVDAGFLNATS